jgi:alpha-1,2-glucosyltransferase
MAQDVQKDVAANVRRDPPPAPDAPFTSIGPGAASSVGLWVLVTATLLSGYFCHLGVPLICDENTYNDQIQMFLRGDFSLTDGQTQIPGYHAFIALVAKLVGHSSLPWLRGITLCLSMLSVVVFFATSVALDFSSGKLRTLQYLYLPIVFPYFFLLYTDIASLLVVLLMLHAAIRGRPALAGVWGAVSILVRQNNIVWVAFVLLLLLLADQERHTTLRGKVSGLLRSLATASALRSSLRAYWPFLLTFLGFAAFVVVNRGIALKDQRGIHPFPAIFFGNVYFILFLGFFLFLPLLVAHARLIVRRLRTHPVLVALLLSAFYVFFLYTFKNDHPYNQSQAFLRNRILAFSCQDIWHKTTFFIPVALSLLSLSVVRLRDPRYYLLYPFTVLCLLPSWLIEDRYCMIPVVFFLLFVETREKVVEYVTPFLYIFYLLFIALSQALYILSTRPGVVT